MKIILCAILSAGFTGAIHAGDAEGRKITQSQVNILAKAALLAKEASLPGIEVVPESNAGSRYEYVTVTWRGPPNGGSVVVESFAIDLYTGDVFSSTSSCDEKKNNNLSHLQKKIRAQLHLSPESYRKLKTKGPMC